MMHFEKFPRIKCEDGSFLIWDSRQDAGDSETIVLLDRWLEKKEIAEELLVRPGAKRVVASREWEDFLSASEIKIQIVKNASAFMGQCTSKFYNEPSKKMHIIGITGTNGKSSIAEILGQCFLKSGSKVLVLGTLGARLFDPTHSFLEAKETVDMGFTTPEGPAFHSLLNQAASEGVEYVVAEVSSHALVLGRVSGIEFDQAIFSNLSQDHLDFHRTMESYAEAKAKLFNDYLATSSKKEKFAILGLANDNSKKVRSCLSPTNAYDLKFVEESDIVVEKQSSKEMKFEYKGLSFTTPLIGEFNAWNLSLACEALRNLEFGDKKIVECFSELRPIVGRLERCAENVFVDFAHTPDALRSVLMTLRKLLHPGGKIICVFGCGGDRDKQKRPLMGAIANKFSDVIYVTSDNPRSEDPTVIADEILLGVQGAGPEKVLVELDRRVAIERAIESKNKNDILLVAGKGHESYQIIGDAVKPFSDQQVIKDFLKNSE